VLKVNSKALSSAEIGADQYCSDLTFFLALIAKPFGIFGDAWGDNVVSWLIHVILT
jgi:hypothetical protein